MCAAILWHQALGKLSLAEVEFLHVQSPRVTTKTKLEIDLGDQECSVPLTQFSIMLTCRLQLYMAVLVLNDDRYI